MQHRASVTLTDVPGRWALSDKRWDLNPQPDRVQPARCHVIALFASSVALHWRCRRATLGGTIWLPLTLICNV